VNQSSRERRRSTHAYRPRAAEVSGS
jgi:hypothetical protein